MTHPRTLLLIAATALTSVPPVLARAAPEYTLFESGQVRPLALSPDGKLLFAANTPDNRLEIFQVRPSGLTHVSSVPVGLEPVAVAARSSSEVWVVNHLSDSVSVVQVASGGQSGRVVRTLLVGDEPRDLVFAGPRRDRAFITAAHRGQNAPFDPQLTTPGVGRADVWVFDAVHLGAPLGGTPLSILTLFADTPRALAVSADGRRVYAAAFHSGNRTTVISEAAITDGFGPDGLPGPSTSASGVPAPETGLIVKFDGAHWVDELGRVWDDKVRFSLPDKDVFAIDAAASPPALVAGPGGSFAGVGTVLFGMVVNPVSGKVYVSNTEASNEVRFEGPGNFTGSTVRGHLHESRITVLSAGGVAPRHLNKHIDYSTCCLPAPNAESETSLAFPQGMAITADGSTLFVAALGSNKIGVFATAALENDSFVPSQANQIEVSGGGPTGIVLDGPQRRLYVLTRFDNAISIVDTAARAEIGHVSMHNPEPPSVLEGRRFLYDARNTSSHGDSACASCHVFGDLDSLAWDLGNPDDEPLANPGPFTVNVINFFTGLPIADGATFHPMKGPMTTQSLRGMANHGPMHWRGDRTGGNEAPSVQPDSGTFDEVAAFKKFNPAFMGLIGRDAPLGDADMQAFTDFILQVTYPPNPIRALDNSLTPDQQAGLEFFNGPRVDGLAPCSGCHVLDRTANPGVATPGLFGTSGQSSFDFQPQLLKVPHFRNLYQKVGMFGMAENAALVPANHQHQGDQIRGFGFLHDGSFDSIFRFVSIIPFTTLIGNPEGIPLGPQGDVSRRHLEQLLLAFDSNLAPIVGQQVTLRSGGLAAVGPRIDLLRARADRGECDLIAKGAVGAWEFGFVYTGAGQFQANIRGVPTVSDGALRQLGQFGGLPLTYTCAPPGSGRRMGIDRDGDGHLDGDEVLAGSDPADPASRP